MNLRIQFGIKNIAWSLVPDILQKAGMVYQTEEIHKRTSGNSFYAILGQPTINNNEKY